nr:putative ribonuclease H-like domain-containing protein [Tanacetum cinerariifolium]
MFAVCAYARFQVTPKSSHLYVVKRIFRYLKGQPKLGLWYPRDSPFNLEAFSDSDYAGASLDRKSTTGGCQFLRKRLISWQCKKQTVVANSTTEAEYVAAATCCGHVLWIQNQMLDYGFNLMNTKIYIDNESTICIVKNLVFHSKTKHLEIRHHFIRDSYKKKLIHVIKIHTDHNVADLLTKSFDDSAKVKTINEDVQIRALVDRKKIIITQASIRRDLQIQDAKGFFLWSKSRPIKQLKLRSLRKESRSLKQEEKENSWTKEVVQGGENVEQDATVNDVEVSVAADKVVTTAESVEGITAATTPQIFKYDAKDKGKGIMVEPEKPLKKKVQLEFDEEVAKNLDAQMKVEMEEEERITREKDEANKAKTQAEVTEGSSKRAEDEIERESAKRQRLKKEDDTTELKRCLEIVLEDDDDETIKATPLSSKSHTIVDYKIFKERKKSYFKIIKADGNSQNYLTFGIIFKNFNREDLEVLRSIVKDRFKKTKLVNDMDNLLF